MELWYDWYDWIMIDLYDWYMIELWLIYDLFMMINMMMNMMIYLALNYKMVFFLHGYTPLFHGRIGQKKQLRKAISSVGASWFLNLAEMESTGLCLSCP